MTGLPASLARRRLAPDRLGGDGRAAGAVDAEQDGAHARILGGHAEGADRRVSAHDRGSRQRVVRAVAAGDEAGAVDQRDRRPALMRPAGAIEIARQRDELRVVAGARARRRDRLVAIAEMIDEMRVDRLLRRERAPVDQLAHLAGLEPASLGDAAHDLPVDGVEQRLGLLAMRRRHLGFGQDVHRRLVFARDGRSAAAMPSLSSAPRKNGVSTRKPIRPTSPNGCSQISSKAEPR